ncbi:hypothetical protein [Dietzia sp. 179-F 9C3 NHS]|uniref:hypothetical protein n=1 Tax=Dietzia sp. 179-F 9C3 NHS TaxID=3374295 RepID=UPI00387A5904
MSMQPYQQNPIELKKQQVRRHAPLAAVGIGGTVVFWPLAMFVASGFTLFAILSTVLMIYSGLKVRKAIAKDPNSPY